MRFIFYNTKEKVFSDMIQKWTTLKSLSLKWPEIQNAKLNDGPLNYSSVSSKKDWKSVKKHGHSLLSQKSLQCESLNSGV